MVNIKDKNTFWHKGITILLIVAFTLTSTPCLEEAYALSPWAGMQKIATRRAMLNQAIELSKVLYAEEGESALKGSDALLLSHGKILLSPELKNNPLRQLRTIFHEEIEAVMQILEKQNRSRYSHIMNLVLSDEKIVKAYKLVTRNTDTSKLTDELLFNDIIASAFELLILLEDKALSRKEMTPEEREFIDAITPAIMASKHNFFTGIFWDQYARESNIRVSMANGQKFKQVASSSSSSSSSSEDEDEEKTPKRKKKSRSKRRSDGKESKWAVFDRFVQKLNIVEDNVIIEAEKAEAVGIKREVLVNAGIEEAYDVDSTYLLSAISKAYEIRKLETTKTDMIWTDLLSYGGKGRFLICYNDSNPEDGLIVKIPSSGESFRYADLYSLNGAKVALKRLGGNLAATSMIFDSRERGKPLKFRTDDRGVIETDVAIVQEKLLPLVEHLKRLGRKECTLEDLNQAYRYIDKLKELIIAMYKRGVVDNDVFNIIGNYGIRKSDNSIALLDLGELSDSKEDGRAFVEDLEHYNELLIEAFEEIEGTLLDPRISEYYAGVQLKPKDFIKDGKNLFGSEYDPKSSRIIFPYSDQQVRQLFAGGKILKSKDGGTRLSTLLLIAASVILIPTFNPLCFALVGSIFMYAVIKSELLTPLKRLFKALPKVKDLRTRGYKAIPIYSSKIERITVNDPKFAKEWTTVYEHALKAKNDVSVLCTSKGFSAREHAALRTITHELIFNQLDHANGGAFGYGLHEKDGKAYGMELIAWDSGPGIEDPNMLLQKSDILRKKVQEGWGFYWMSRDADEIIIESKGKLWTRGYNGKFFLVGESNITEGSRIRVTVNIKSSLDKPKEEKVILGVISLTKDMFEKTIFGMIAEEPQYTLSKALDIRLSINQLVIKNRMENNKFVTDAADELIEELDKVIEVSEPLSDMNFNRNDSDLSSSLESQKGAAHLNFLYFLGGIISLLALAGFTYLKAPGSLEAFKDVSVASNMLQFAPLIGMAAWYVKKKEYVHPEKPLHEEWGVFREEGSERLVCYLNIYSYGHAIGYIRLGVENRGIILYTCSGFRVREGYRRRGFGEFLAKRGFTLAMEEARRNGIDPKWAFAWYTLSNIESNATVSPVTTLLGKFGFSEDETTSIKEDEDYDSLESLKDEFPNTEQLGHRGYGRWFVKIDQLEEAFNRAEERMPEVSKLEKMLPLIMGIGIAGLYLSSISISGNTSLASMLFALPLLGSATSYNTHNATRSGSKTETTRVPEENSGRPGLKTILIAEYNRRYGKFSDYLKKAIEEQFPGVTVLTAGTTSEANTIVEEKGDLIDAAVANFHFSNPSQLHGLDEDERDEYTAIEILQRTVNQGLKIPFIIHSGDTWRRTLKLKRRIQKYVGKVLNVSVLRRPHVDDIIYRLERIDNRLKHKNRDIINSDEKAPEKKILIVYHSGTGGTLKISNQFKEKLSGKYQVDLMEANAKFDGDLSEYEMVLFGFPTFGLRPSPSILEFVNRLERSKKPVKAFIFCTKSTVSNNTLRKFAKHLLGKNIITGGFEEFRAPGSDLVLDFPEKLTRKIHKLFDMAFGYHRNTPAKIDRSVKRIDRLVEDPSVRLKMPRWKFNTLFWGPLQKHVFDSFPINIAPLEIISERCFNCNSCAVKFCARGAWKILANSTPEWIKEKCDRCMSCVHKCPKKAIIYNEEMKDRPRLDDKFHDQAEKEYLLTSDTKKEFNAHEKEKFFGPGTPHIDQPMDSSKEEEDFHDASINMYANPSLKDKIIVRKGESSVTLLVKELSELNAEEQKEALRSLCDWIDYDLDKNGGKIPSLRWWETVDESKVPLFGSYDNYVVHIRDLLYLINLLDSAIKRGTSVEEDPEKQIYLAISSSEVNGTKRSFVEGLTRITRFDDSADNITLWEIAPHNRDLLLEEEREGWQLSSFEKKNKGSRKFTGVARQMLWHVVYRELDSFSEGLVFALYAERALESDGVKGFKEYTQYELMRLILKRSKKTLETLNSTAKSTTLGELKAFEPHQKAFLDFLGFDVELSKITEVGDGFGTVKIKVTKENTPYFEKLLMGGKQDTEVVLLVDLNAGTPLALFFDENPSDNMSVVFLHDEGMNFRYENTSPAQRLEAYSKKYLLKPHHVYLSFDERNGIYVFPSVYMQSDLFWRYFSNLKTLAGKVDKGNKTSPEEKNRVLIIGSGTGKDISQLWSVEEIDEIVATEIDPISFANTKFTAEQLLKNNPQGTEISLYFQENLEGLGEFDLISFACPLAVTESIKWRIPEMLYQNIFSGMALNITFDPDGKITKSIIEEASRHLKPGGKFLLLNHHVPEVYRWMEEEGFTFEVEELTLSAAKTPIVLYRATKNDLKNANAPPSKKSGFSWIKNLALITFASLFFAGVFSLARYTAYKNFERNQEIEKLLGGIDLSRSYEFAGEAEMMKWLGTLSRDIELAMTYYIKEDGTHTVFFTAIGDNYSVNAPRSKHTIHTHPKDFSIVEQIPSLADLVQALSEEDNIVVLAEGRVVKISRKPDAPLTPFAKILKEANDEVSSFMKEKGISSSYAKNQLIEAVLNRIIFDKISSWDIFDYGAGEINASYYNPNAWGYMVRLFGFDIIEFENGAYSDFWDGDKETLNKLEDFKLNGEELYKEFKERSGSIILDEYETHFERALPKKLSNFDNAPGGAMTAFTALALIGMVASTKGNEKNPAEVALAMTLDLIKSGKLDSMTTEEKDAFSNNFGIDTWKTFLPMVYTVANQKFIASTKLGDPELTRALLADSHLIIRAMVGPKQGFNNIKFMIILGGVLLALAVGIPMLMGSLPQMPLALGVILGTVAGSTTPSKKETLEPGDRKTVILSKTDREAIRPLIDTIEEGRRRIFRAVELSEWELVRDLSRVLHQDIKNYLSSRNSGVFDIVKRSIGLEPSMILQYLDAEESAKGAKPKKLDLANAIPGVANCAETIISLDDESLVPIVEKEVQPGGFLYDVFENIIMLLEAVETKGEITLVKLNEEYTGKIGTPYIVDVERSVHLESDEYNEPPLEVVPLEETKDKKNLLSANKDGRKITAKDIVAAMDEINAESDSDIFPEEQIDSISEKITTMRLKGGDSFLVVGPSDDSYLPVLLTKLGIKTALIDTAEDYVEEQGTLHKKFGLEEKIERFTSYGQLEGRHFDHISLFAVLNYALEVPSTDEIGGLESWDDRESPEGDAVVAMNIKTFIEPIIRLLTPDGGNIHINDMVECMHSLDQCRSNPKLSYYNKLHHYFNLALLDYGKESGIDFKLREDVNVDDLTLSPSFFGEMRTGVSYSASIKEPPKMDIKQVRMTFHRSMPVLMDTSYNDYAARSIQVSSESDAPLEGGGIILYADDILNSTAALDLENTVRKMSEKGGVLSNSKVILYAKKEKASALVLEEMIKRASPNIETVIITSEELASRKNLDGTENDEVAALVKFAKSKGAGNLLGLIKGPTKEPEELANLSRSLRIPVVIVGLEEALYSFAEAMVKALETKKWDGARGWLIILPPIRTISDDIRQKYLEYQMSLQALVAA